MRHLVVRLALAIAACSIAGHAFAQTRAGERVALVVGNSDYLRQPLKNARADARAMAQQLRASGFTVTLLENSRRDALDDALREFTLRSRTARVRVLYYAGHGAQLGGQNYLLPTDVTFLTPDEFTARATNLSGVVERLSRNPTGVNVVIVDACRDVPIQVAANIRSNFPPIAGGFAPMEAPSGTLVAFSTSPGAVARDGGVEGNSPYTKHLLAQMQIPALPVEDVFKAVRTAVKSETNNQQLPWEMSSVTGRFCFRTGPNGECGR
jgi:uncharacterized caspase-like protein